MNEEKEYPMTLKRIISKWDSSALLRKIYYKWYDNLIHDLSITEKDKILEVGCGVGFFANYLKDKFPKIDYTGFDYVKDAVQIARTRTDTKFIVADFNKYTTTERFDKIVCVDFIHHVNFITFFTKIKELLRPNGMFGCIEPNRNFISKIVCLLGLHHENVFEHPNLKQLINRAEVAGFKVNTKKYFNAVDYPLSGGFSKNEHFLAKTYFIELNKLLSKFSFLCWKFKLTLRLEVTK